MHTDKVKTAKYPSPQDFLHVSLSNFIHKTEKSTRFSVQIFSDFFCLPQKKNGRNRVSPVFKCLILPLTNILSFW